MSFTINKQDLQTITRLKKNELDIAFNKALLKGEGLDDDFKKVNCNYSQHYFFKDNNSNVLAVAHLDTVQPDDWYYIQNNILYSPVTDDRMGVYVLLYMLPRLGVNVDILLTIGEESLNSSAQFFYTEKQYNWMFSFDRKGEDVVTYSYHNEKFENALLKNGFRFGLGSYSDIVELEQLDCCGVNIGTGFFNYHDLDGYVDLKMLMRQVLRFRNFYNENNSTFFKSEDKYNHNSRFGYSTYSMPKRNYEVYNEISDYRF